jgi:D-threo-aldose 1-dehydrogenase
MLAPDWLTIRGGGGAARVSPAEAVHHTAPVTHPNRSTLARRRFGSTDLQVTPICIGTAALGSMPETFAYDVPADRALATLRAFADSPINFLDTAASYGDGESERRIGLFLRERALPDGFVLSTKADRDLQTGDFSGDQIRRSVERSLRLLGLDHLQVVFLHDPEHTMFLSCMAPGGPVDVLLRFKEEGVIEHVGVAGGPVDMEIQYVETGVFDAVITHNRYTLLNRSAAPLLDLAFERGVAVLNAAPYGSGLLAKGPDRYARYAYQDASPEMVKRTRHIQSVCARYGVPLAAASLQFSLRDPRITSTIVGVTRPERIDETLSLAAAAIPEGLWQELDALPFDRLDPEVSRWTT